MSSALIDRTAVRLPDDTRRSITVAFHKRHAVATQVSFGTFIEPIPIRGVSPLVDGLLEAGQLNPDRRSACGRLLDAIDWTT